MRDLISEKKKWVPQHIVGDQRKRFSGWNERGYLPHCDAPGLVQFVTFRLHDTFPRSRRQEWEHLLKIEDNTRRRSALEGYLDRGGGACHLRRVDLARMVEETFLYFHSDRYDLRAWVVMPNHVHVLFEAGEVPMRRVIESWKKRSGRLANISLGCKGPFWAADYWDTYMRNSDQEKRAIRYIENNPVKAGLVSIPKAWHSSSARFRDSNGLLVLPS